MMHCRILLGDDHAVVLGGQRRILDQPGFDVVEAVKDGRALVEAAQKLRPDVIAADIACHYSTAWRRRLKSESTTPNRKSFS
jgi:DNA-binding NarL/FixJ family response regulator